MMNAPPAGVKGPANGAGGAPGPGWGALARRRGSMPAKVGGFHSGGVTQFVGGAVH